MNATEQEVRDFMDAFISYEYAMNNLLKAAHDRGIKMTPFVEVLVPLNGIPRIHIQSIQAETDAIEITPEQSV